MNIDNVVAEYDAAGIVSRIEKRCTSTTKELLTESLFSYLGVPFPIAPFSLHWKDILRLTASPR